MTPRRKTVGKRTRKALTTARWLPGNRWLGLAIRFGYAVRGALYFTTGILALQIVFGAADHEADPNEALRLAAGTLVGRILIVIGLGGLIAYALWGYMRALLDPLRRGRRPSGVVDRLGFLWSGLSYTALAVFAFQALGGTPGRSHRSSAEVLVARALQEPAGRAVAVVLGALVLLGGAGQVLKGAQRRFRADLDLRDMNRAERTWAIQLGRAGTVSRGVVYGTIGWFIIVAALLQDPSRAVGMRGAFQVLQSEPLGIVLAAAASAGFMALGAHSGFCAIWIHWAPRASANNVTLRLLSAAVRTVDRH